MAKCVPGMPCYGAGVTVYTTYPAGCSITEPSPFTLPLSSDDVIYTGANLPYSGIQTEDTITDAIQKIDEKLDSYVIQRTTVTLSAAEIATVYSTPIRLVAAPGANKLIFVNHVYVAYTFV